MAMADLAKRNVLEPVSSTDLSTIFDSQAPLSCVSVSVSVSVSDSETLIYIGTSSGSLLLLSLNYSDASLQNVSLLRSVSVGDSSVDAIIVLADIRMVMLLCEGQMYLVDSVLAQPVKRLGNLKGVDVIAKRVRSSEEESTDSSVFASLEASSRTSQRIFQRLGGGVKANGGKMKEVYRTTEGINAFAVVAGKRLMLMELVFASKIGREIDCSHGSLVILKEIQCIDGVKAIVWLNDSIIAGTANGYSLFSCVTGHSGVIFTLPEFSSPPILKLLWKEKKVLLLVDNVGIIVNSHGQPVGGSLVFNGVPDSVGELGSYVLIVRDGKLQLHHKKSGSCVQSVTFGGKEVGKCVIADEQRENGELVALATPTKIICYKKVPYEEQIKDLLRKKNFKEAVSLVEELDCEGEMSKEVLSFVHAQVGFLLLFDLHFKEAVDHFLKSETMQPSEVFPFIMRDPNRWSLLVPKSRYWGLHPPPAPLEDVVDDGLVAIQRAIFLKKAGVDTVVDDQFLSNPPTRADLLEAAIKNLIRYLEVSRKKELTLPVKEGVDTLLMYLYRALNLVSDMENLASSENSCVVEELESILGDFGHLRALAFLYTSKGMSSKSLAIWRILARNYNSGLWKDPAVEKNSYDGGMKISAGETAAIEASKILEKLSNHELVLQHLGWIADINTGLAVQVLTSEKRENPLSPDDVIAAIDPTKVEILQSYLKWLIEDQDSGDAQFHTLYALSLAKSAIDFEAESASQDSVAGRPEKNLSDVGRNSIFQTPVRERLQIFLMSSDLYDPEMVLDLIEESELWLEKAILYRKLGQETLVLQILALKLEDSEAAEQYCVEIGRPDAYMQLLDMYLDPQNGREPMFKAAVRLLHNHGESLDPLQVLETLSPDMPLQLASDTIFRMLRARVHHHRQGQIVHNLSCALDIDARLARLEERSRHVQITDESLCDSCHARLGTKLFAMYPDDTVVCYKCFRRQGESTSVTGRNFKQDVLFKPGWLVTG